MASADEIATHPFYNGFRAKHGLGSFIGALVSPHGHLPVIVTMQGRAGQPAYSDDDVKAFERLAQHVERALLLTVRLLEAATAQLALADALSRLSCGVFLLDADGRVMFRNAVAARLIATHMVMDGDVLRLPGAAAGPFARACRAVIAGGSEEHVQHPTIIEQADGGRVALYVLPCAPTTSAKTAFGASRALVLAITQSGAEPADPGLVRDLLGLTLGEARLASLIGAGRSPDDAATALGITGTSARTVLKRVFAKTGVSRQAELATLIARLPAYK